MNKLYFLVAILSLGILSSFTVIDCSILKNNSFEYKVGNKEIVVVFGEDEYIEYHEEKNTI